VALSTLAKVYTPSANNPNPSQTDTTALQRHRQVVLECLRDPDISIRRRALDLSFQLVNPQNVRALTRELLNFLELASSDMKASTASRICNVAAAFRPNRRWEIDTVTRVLRAAGSQVEQDVVNQYIKIVSTAPQELQAYATKKLFAILKDDTVLAQDGLVLVGLWCLGEYADLLVGADYAVERDEEEEDVSVTVSEADVLDMLDRICSSGYATDEVKEYAVTALAKLVSRFPSHEARIKTMMSKFTTNMHVEVQQRATEYTQLFGLERDVRDALLERIPVLEQAKLEDERKGRGETFGVGAGTVSSGAAIQVSSAADDLLGMDMDMASSPVVPSGVQKSTDLLADLLVGSTGGSLGSVRVKSDPLADLLGGMSTETKASKPADLLSDIFGSPAPKPAAAKPAAAKPAVEKQGDGVLCYNKQGLSITLDPTRAGDIVTVVIRFANTSVGELSNLSFQVAVPKSMKLQILPPSSTTIQAGGSATQTIKIANPSKVRWTGETNDLGCD